MMCLLQYKPQKKYSTRTKSQSRTKLLTGESSETIGTDTSCCPSETGGDGFIRNLRARRAGARGCEPDAGAILPIKGLMIKTPNTAHAPLKMSEPIHHHAPLRMSEFGSRMIEEKTRFEKMASAFKRAQNFRKTWENFWEPRVSFPFPLDYDTRVMLKIAKPNGESLYENTQGKCVPINCRYRLSFATSEPEVDVFACTDGDKIVLLSDTENFERYLHDGLTNSSCVKFSLHPKELPENFSLTITDARYNKFCKEQSVKIGDGGAVSVKETFPKKARRGLHLYDMPEYWFGQ